MSLSRGRKINLIIVLTFSVLIILSAFYVRNSWLKTIQEVSQKAVLIAEIAATGIDGEAIQKLGAVPQDEETDAFRSVKKRLESYLKLDKDVRFVYLYVLKGEKLYFMADSESVDSPDYSSSGQEYSEADEIYKQPFLTKKTVITDPVTDRWGTWRSILVPVINYNSGEVFVVLGMDYPFQIWQEQSLIAISRALVQVGIVFLLTIFIFIIFKKVIKKEESYSSLVKNIPGVAYRCLLDKNWTMLFISDQIEAMVGFPAKDFINNKVRTFTSIIHPEDRGMVANEIQSTVGKKIGYDIEYRLENKNNQIIWVKEKGRVVYDKHDKPVFLDGVIFDISKDKEILLEIKKKQEELEKINKFMVGRELKMLELKEEIKTLKKSLHK